MAKAKQRRRKERKKKEKRKRKKEIHVYKSITITDQNIDLYQMCGGWPTSYLQVYKPIKIAGV